jgi:hypothetical protein
MAAALPVNAKKAKSHNSRAVAAAVPPLGARMLPRAKSAECVNLPLMSAERVDLPLMSAERGELPLKALPSKQRDQIRPQSVRRAVLKEHRAMSVRLMVRDPIAPAPMILTSAENSRQARAEAPLAELAQIETAQIEVDLAEAALSKAARIKAALTSVAKDRAPQVALLLVARRLAARPGVALPLVARLVKQ